jgi:hypothetical protein
MAILNVPITKAKASLEIDTDKLPDEVYKEALLQGLKVLANRGASKITKEAYPEAEEMKAAALAKGQEQVDAIYTGKIKFTGGAKSAKESGKVMTEARRLARNLVKDEMKRQGIKISHVEAKEITKAANDVLSSETGPSIIEMAKANLAEREKAPIAIDVSKIAISEKLVAKAEAKKSKDQLSAKQAGKVKQRAKAEARA